MFNPMYALIGVFLGFLLGRLSDAQIDIGKNFHTGILAVFIVGFLMFSSSFGITWFFIGLTEVYIGSVVGKLFKRGD